MALPSAVFAPVECFQGCHVLINSACHAFRSAVQPFIFLFLHSKLHKDAPRGELLYIKPAFYNAEKDNTPVDIFHYAQGSESFPHETTADQFFSESQFESYRRLGVFSMCDMLKTFKKSPSTIEYLVKG